jgi:hypothetical protein
MPSAVSRTCSAIAVINGDMQQRWVAEPEFVEMIREGLVVDAATIAAYGLLLLTPR